MAQSRKHARSYEDDLYPYNDKRIKLDNLFNELSLAEKEYQSRLEPEGTYIVNPKIKQYPNFKKPAGPTNTGGSTINSYIAEKLIDHFNNVIASNLLVLRWYNPKRLVIYRLERWTIKMFNRFLKKYNIHHNVRIKLVKSCDTIFQMIRQNNLHYMDLLKILFQENTLELCRLNEKRLKKEELHDVRYDYWDGRFKNMHTRDSEVDSEDAMEIEQELNSMYPDHY